MRTTEVFKPVRVWRGDKMVRGFEASCRHCTNRASVPANPIGGFSSGNDAVEEIRLVTRKFVKEGWVIGKGAAHHECPECAQKRAAARVVNASKEIVKLKKDPMLAAAPPAPPADDRKLTREHRRIIFDKLNEVYASEVEGYRGNWNDQRVAETLGAPIEWIATVRVENFGDETGNAAAAKLREIIEEGRKLLIDCAACRVAARDANEKLAAMDARSSELEKRLADAVAALT